MKKFHLFLLYFSVFIFILTFTDRACDSCMFKLYVAYYRCEIVETFSRGTNHPGHAQSVALRQLIL